MLIALVGLNANAAMYLVGTAPLGQGWDPSKGVEMTDNNDGTYTYDVVINGDVWFCFADGLNANWDVFNGQYRYGPTGGNDQTVTAGAWTTTQKQGNGDGAYYFHGSGDKYTVTFDKTNLKFMIDGYVEPVVYESFTVAGNKAAIFGEMWNVTLAENDMTLDETDGSYKLVKENVEIANVPDTLYYKVAANHAWGESWGNPNGPDGNQDYIFNQNGTYNLTFKFNFDTKEVTLDVEPVQSSEVTDVFIIGDVNNFSTAEGWDPTKGAQMTLADSVYTATVNAVVRDGQEYAYFGFTKKIADPESQTPWDDIAAFRFGPVSEGDFLMTQELLGTQCALATDGSYQSIAIPAGEWAVTVNLVNNTFSINGEWPVDTVVPEPAVDVFIIGDVNNFSTAEGWDPTKGAQMTLADSVYTATVNAVVRDGQEYAYFGFTKKIADAESETPWDDIESFRFGPVSEGDFLMTQELLGTQCALATDGSHASIAIPAGEWAVTVNLANNTFSINGEWPVDTVVPEPAVDVFIIGDVNNFSTAEGWDPTKGAQMTLADSVYTATVNAVVRDGQEYAYFGFTKKIADAESETPWDDIESFRFGPVSEGDFLMTQELLGTQCALATDGSHASIAIPAGEWAVTVNLANNTFSINGEWPVDTIVPEPYTGDVYILGEVNNNGGWFPNIGVQMTRDAQNNVYTATITTTGENEGYSYFSFTKLLAENDWENGGWEEIAAYRFGAVSEDDFWVTEETLGVDIALEMSGDAFKIEAGTWNLTLSVDNMTLVIEAANALRGDVNEDHAVTIADVTALIDILLSGATAPASADCNLDHGVTIADVTALIDYLLTGNWPAAK